MIVKSILSPREHDKKYSSKGKFVIRLINKYTLATKWSIFVLYIFKLFEFYKSKKKVNEVWIKKNTFELSKIILYKNII